MDNNICRFLPESRDSGEINVLNFVYEKENQFPQNLRYDTVFKMHLVVKGSGAVHVFGDKYEVSEGDLFFSFPAFEYSLESGEDFEYMYISCFGARINKITDKLGVNRKNFVFKGNRSLISLWKDSILENKTTFNLRCEGILLYSFSKIAEEEQEFNGDGAQNAMLIKKHIDENFSDKNLSLEILGEKFSYSGKYISKLFKDEFNVGISQYINMLRVHKARTLIEQGFTSVKDIASRCGFSDQFYFSRVFKEKTGVSPKEYIMNINY